MASVAIFLFVVELVGKQVRPATVVSYFGQQDVSRKLRPHAEIGEGDETASVQDELAQLILR
jgi:hypothetical protein